MSDLLTVATLIGRIAENPETVIISGPQDQDDGDEPRYNLSISGPQRLIEPLEQLLSGEDPC